MDGTSLDFDAIKHFPRRSRINSKNAPFYQLFASTPMDFFHRLELLKCHNLFKICNFPNPYPRIKYMYNFYKFSNFINSLDQDCSQIIDNFDFKKAFRLHFFYQVIINMREHYLDSFWHYIFPLPKFLGWFGSNKKVKSLMSNIFQKLLSKENDTKENREFALQTIKEFRKEYKYTWSAPALDFAAYFPLGSEPSEANETEEVKTEVEAPQIEIDYDYSNPDGTMDDNVD